MAPLRDPWLITRTIYKTPKYLAIELCTYVLLVAALVLAVKHLEGAFLFVVLGAVAVNLWHRRVVAKSLGMRSVSSRAPWVSDPWRDDDAPRG